MDEAVGIIFFGMLIFLVYGIAGCVWEWLTERK